MAHAELVKITQSLIIMVGLADKILAIHARFSKSMAHARLVMIIQLMENAMMVLELTPSAMVASGTTPIQTAAVDMIQLTSFLPINAALVMVVNNSVQHVKPFTNLMKPNELV